MNQINRLLAALAAGVTALVVAGPAMAQATRTWVSGVGDDANPCSRTAPCKTFAGAISKTATDGIINALDPGGFGTLTITKSITIDGGNMSGTLASGGINGFNVNGAGVKVILRNLAVEGAGTGAIGVNFIQGASLTLENVRIYGFRGGSAMGVRMTVGGQLTLKDTNITDCLTGVHLETGASPIFATLDNVRIENTANFGLQTANIGQVNVMVKHSVVNNNAGVGIQTSGPGGNVTVVDSSMSFNTGTSVNAAFSGSIIRLASNTIVNNGNAIGIAAGATVASDGTNRIAGIFLTAPNAAFTNQ
ncbi:MAG TPA: right-handed parallel beta-helix repeat-containing protein [Usitatibacter sp.]|nr:right-handed parallel beta-helix repeat-containing protein [Usitatibacter sp.]